MTSASSTTQPLGTLNDVLTCQAKGFQWSRSPLPHDDDFADERCDDNDDYDNNDNDDVVDDDDDNDYDDEYDGNNKK